MKQENGTVVRYAVDVDETVTLTIVAHKSGDFRSVSLDGSSWDTMPDDSTSYQQKLAGPVGRLHHAFIVVTFADDAPKDARYEVSLKGDQGGVIAGPSIGRKGSRVGITFRMV